MRPNPYNQIDSEGHLINPNDGSSIWYHYTNTDILEFDMENFHVRRSFMYVSENTLDETYFAGSSEDHWLMGRGHNVCLHVKIKLGPECRLFDARELFLDAPAWIVDDVERAYRETEDVFEVSDLMPDGQGSGLSEETFKYFNQGDLGKTLNAWRETYDRNAFGSPAMFFVSLWALEYSLLMSIFRDEPDRYPILDTRLTKGLVGWLERESVDSLSPECNPINAAVAHNARGSKYIDKDCLAQTAVQVVKRDRVRHR